MKVQKDTLHHSPLPQLMTLQPSYTGWLCFMFFANLLAGISSDHLQKLKLSRAHADYLSYIKVLNLMC